MPSYKPDLVNNPNEAYAVHNGVPVWHFPADKRELAERFATDHAYRQQRANPKKAHE